MSSLRYLAILAIAMVTMQSLVNAHFTVTYPSSRGFDESKEALAPCGGFDTASSQRIQMPLKSAYVEIDSGHVAYTYVINALTGNNPAASEFTSANIKSVAEGSRSYPAASCLPLTFDNSFKSNTNVTLQIVYNGGDGLLYQCIDATLVDSAANFDTQKCSNADGSATNVGSSASSSPSASASGSTASNQPANQATSVSIAYGLTFMAAVGISLLLA